MRSHTPWLYGAALLLSAPLFAACADAEPTAPINLQVRALGDGASCGGGSSPSFSSVSVAVFDEDDDKIGDANGTVAGGNIATVPGVTAGADLRLDLTAGASDGSTWFGQARGVDVQEQPEPGDNDISMVLSKVGAMTRGGAPAESINTVFPASAKLGDGRIAVFGGFSSASATLLSDPVDGGFIYDPSGAQETVDIGASGCGGRGAHVAAWLAGPTKDHPGSLLVAGGATSLPIGSAEGFPVGFPADDNSDGDDDPFTAFHAAALADYAVYNLAESAWESCPGGVDTMMTIPRIFPRASTMSDGLVVISGGGWWPYSGVAADRALDVFDGQKIETQIGDTDEFEYTPGFLPVFNWHTDSARTGHSATEIKIEGGISFFLFWGGTADGPAGELMRGSSLLADGVNGSFIPLEIEGDATNVWFHETVRLRADEEAGTIDFLVVGGSHASGMGDVTERSLAAPGADLAWLLTYRAEVDEEGGIPTKHVVSVAALPGLGAGRVFHSLVSTDRGHHATVLGGCGAEASVSTFDGSSFRNEKAESTFTARCGQAAAVTNTGTAILYGGEGFPFTDTSPSNCGYLDIFTPSYAGDN